MVRQGGDAWVITYIRELTPFMLWKKNREIGNETVNRSQKYKGEKHELYHIHHIRFWQIFIYYIGRHFHYFRIFYYYYCI